MRIIISLGLAILLSACTTTTANYYTSTAQSWRGEKVSTLIQHWGSPDVQMPGSNGGKILIYKTETYHATNNTQGSPAIGVNVSPSGKPLITTANAPINHSTLTLTCTAIFTANAHGIITRTLVQGEGCYGGEVFANRLNR